MKIGIVIQHYDARNDVRELVAALVKKHKLVLFGADEILRSLRTDCEKRAFIQRKRFTDRMWLTAWGLFGNLPLSRGNFLVTELFKLASLSPLRRAIAGARLRFRVLMPALISYDFLLDRLVGSDSTQVNDIDRFLIITEVSNTRFLSRILSSGKHVEAYVYSWDHACKHATFSKRVQRWLVWHAGITDDLIELQGLQAEKVTVVGATQLSYIHEYLATPEFRRQTYSKKYIYYGCGVGVVEIARQEAKLIGLVAEILEKIDDEVILLVRPYPMLAEMEFFKALRRHKNIRFDEAYRRNREDRSLSRESIFERLNLQEHAIAFLHCGTTMGLEGAFFDTPSIFLALEDFDHGTSPGATMHLNRFINQHHNVKYMMLSNYRNVVRTSRSLQLILIELVSGKSNLSEYNKRLTKDLPLQSLEAIANKLFAE